MKKTQNKHSKGFLIKLTSGIALSAIAIISAFSIMIPSKLAYDEEYKALMDEKTKQEYINSLPLELTGISAELAEGVRYYDNNTASPERSDFSVKANFSEKGREFSKKLAAKDFTIAVPDDFAKKGGTVFVSYTYTPEKSEDSTEEVKPVTKTADVHIDLIEPDETIFWIKKEPTFTKTGIAENINGVKKVLPVLNNTNYAYSTTTDGDYGCFTYTELNLTIKKEIVEEIIFTTTDDKSLKFNNLTCHFANIDNLAMSYNEDTFVLEGSGDSVFAYKGLKIGEHGYNEANQKVVFASGSFSFASQIAMQTIEVRSGATLSMTSSIKANQVTVEAGATLNISTTSDGLILANRGKSQLFGNVTVTNSSGNKQNTGINCRFLSFIELSETSRVTISGYEWPIGSFSFDDGYTGTSDEKHGYLFVPKTVTKSGTVYSIGEDTVFDFTGNTKDAFCNTTTINNYNIYSIVTEPTMTETGLAKNLLDESYTLPVLSSSEYEIRLDLTSGSVKFYHAKTSLTISSSEGEIEGISVTKPADKSYVVTVDEGFTVNLTSADLSLDSFTLKGKGTLNMNGKLVASTINVVEGATLNSSKMMQVKKEMLVDATSTLNITANVDALEIRNMSTVRLLGTVNINGTNPEKAGINICYGSTLQLAKTSRVKVKGFNYGAGAWYADVTDSDGSKPTKATLRIPQEATLDSNKYLIGTDCIFDFSENTHGIFSIGNIVKEAPYVVDTEPTIDSEGQSTSNIDGATVTLPKFNFTDYDASLSSTNIVFRHLATGLTFTLAYEGTTTVDGFSVSYSSASGYVLNIGEGKNVTLTNDVFSASSLTIQGKGTLNTGKINATNITVESGVTLNATSSQDRVLNISASGEAKLYGTVNVTYTGTTGCALGTNYQSVVRLSSTSRITLSGVYAFGYWPDGSKEEQVGTKVNLYYPTGATKNDNNLTLGEDKILTIAKGIVYNINYVEETA